MPQVYNVRSNVHFIPDDAVYVDSFSKWGNPFRAGQHYGDHIMTREDTVSQHEDWLLYSDEGQALFEEISELTGHDLICFSCEPHWPCHARTLLRLANTGDVPALLEPSKPWSEVAKELGLDTIEGGDPC